MGEHPKAADTLGVSVYKIRYFSVIMSGVFAGFGGAEGQFIIGSMTAAYFGYVLNLPSVIEIPVVITLAVLAAAMWGGIAGYLKSKFEVHEVISTIMLNWIALYLHNYVIMIESFRKPNSEASYSIQDSASITLLEAWKYSDVGKEWLSSNPFWMDFLRPPVNFGIVIALFVGIIIWFLLNKTTLGYSLRAVGFNKYAAEYGGISIKKNIILSMFIAGGLAGLAGATHVLAVSKNISILAAMEGYGFDGIAVALIGSNSPIGCILSGLLFGALKYGGPKIQSGMDAPSEVISIMIGSIVFFIAIPKLIPFFVTMFKSRIRRSKNAN